MHRVPHGIKRVRAARCGGGAQGFGHLVDGLLLLGRIVVPEPQRAAVVVGRLTDAATRPFVVHAVQYALALSGEQPTHRAIEQRGGMFIERGAPNLHSAASIVSICPSRSRMLRSTVSA